MVRLAVARLSFCSNSFSPRRTRSEDVLLHEWLSGDSGLTRSAGSGTELDGVARFAAANPDWDITLLRSASALPGGPLAGSLFTSWLNEVENGLRRGRFDAVYLALHGACQAEGDPSADLTVLRRVRSIMGPLPVVASFDIRANLSEEVAILLDGATSNQLNDPRSSAAAAERALGLLDRIIAGSIRPVGALARLAMIGVGEEFDRSVRDTLELCRPSDRVVETSLFTGFAWGDTPNAGPSALVWADRDAGAAREEAARLAVALSQATFRTQRLALPSAEAGIQIGVAASHKGLPSLVLDPSDDPTRGGMLDTPELLRGLQRAQAFGHLPGRALLAGLFDPESVIAAQKAGLGATISGNFGAQTTQIFGHPVPAVGEVVAMGRSSSGIDHAVIRSGQIDILFLNRRPAMLSPDLLADMGIDISAFQILAIKGSRETEVAFARLVARVVVCDCPGPSDPDLLRLNYNFVPLTRRAIPDDDLDMIEAELPPMPRRRVTDRRAGLYL